jgi:hypothetical protein
MDESLFVRARPVLVRPPRAFDADRGDDFLADLWGSARPFGARGFVEADEQVADAGESVVHMRLLEAHAAPGFNYDLSANNCIVRWANVPNGYSGEVDVVVHYHGYSQHNRMQLQQKADVSGMDFDLPGVTRPTLGLVPHGHAFGPNGDNQDGFNFPAINQRAGLFRFIDLGLGALGNAVSTPATNLRRGRVILTGHSGGGATLRELVRSLGAAPGVHGFQFYDATYGRQDTATVLCHSQAWLSQALERDAQALQALSAGDWPRYMQERGSHLRIVFLEHANGTPTGTGKAATLTDSFIQGRLAQLVSDGNLRTFLRRFYRAQVSTIGPRMNHGALPRRVGGTLLANPASELSGIARDLALPVAPLASAGTVPASRITPVRTSTTSSALDARLGAAIEALLREFMAIPVNAWGSSISVHAPYFMNVVDPSHAAAATLARYRRAENERRSASPPLAALLREERFRHARTGKPTPTELRQFLQAAVDQGLLTGAAGAAAPAEARAFLQRYGIGIDCSGFVSQALNRAIDVFPDARPSDRIADVRSTGSAALKGDSARFQRVTDARDLRVGDTMWLSGHIRIVCRVEASPGAIVFYTAESRAGNADIGPTRARWRLLADPSVNEGVPRFNFAGYRLERADEVDSPTPRWRAGGAHTYSHFRPLRALVERASARSASNRPGEGFEAFAPEDDAALGAAYRAEIIKALEYWKGAREGDEKFARFRTTASLDAARKEAGKTGKTFTTCIEFLGKVQADAARAASAKVKRIDSRVCDPKEQKKLPTGAWHAATRGSAARPKPGDIIFLVFAKEVRYPDGRVRFGRGWFSHVGFFYRSEALAADAVSTEHPAGTEIWHTIDGGQGTSTKFDAQGNLIPPRGAEAIAEVRRMFHPPECLITGERIQGDADQRTLLGWVDVEKLVTGAG